MDINTEELLDRCPDYLRESFVFDYKLGEYKTTLKIGGRAKIYFNAKTVEDLRRLINIISGKYKYFVVGNGSNLLVRDGGISDAVVISLGRGFKNIEFDGTRIIAGGSAPVDRICKEAQKLGLSGLEFLKGIPGTVGGAVRMNAGIPKREMKDVLSSVKVMKSDGSLTNMDVGEIDFKYRSANLPDELIVVGAVFETSKKLQKEIDELVNERENHRNKLRRIRTAGSTFLNPPDKKAWKLIEDSGCNVEFENYPNVRMSSRHCNYLNVKDGCKAKECEEFIYFVRDKVLNESRVELELEVRIIGDE